MDKLTKQRNLLAMLLLLGFAGCCFLFWRIASTADKINIASLLESTVSRQQVDSTISSIQQQWEAKLLEKDSELARYKAMLEKPGETKIIIQTRIEYQDTGSIKTVLVQDSTEIDTFLISECPKYRAEKHNRWLDFEVASDCESAEYKLSFRDSIAVIFRSERQGFLRGSKTTAYLYSQSPYGIGPDEPLQVVEVPKKPSLIVRLIKWVFNRKL